MKRTLLFLGILMLALGAMAQDIPATDPIVNSVTYVPQATAPTSPRVGRRYLNTDNNYYRWNGSAWVLDSGAVASVNGQSGTVVLDADDLNEGTSNKFLTVAERANVAANTAKVGITTQQAADITANNAKVSYPGALEWHAENADNTRKLFVGTQAQEAAATFTGNEIRIITDADPVKVETTATFDLSENKVYDDTTTDATTITLSGAEAAVEFYIYINRATALSFSGMTIEAIPGTNAFAANTPMIFYGIVHPNKTRIDGSYTEINP